MTRRAYDPTLRTQPWKVLAVFDPIERVLHRMQADGTIDAVGGVAVFQDNGDLYEIVPAIEGVIEFHRIARDRYRLDCDLAGLERLAKKLHHSAPIFQADIDAVQVSIDSCKRQAMALRQSQATDIIDTVRISMALDKQAASGPRHTPHTERSAQ